METKTVFTFKYRLRKTDEQVEVIAWETTEKGARNERDWVSYIDAQGNEHIKEHLTLEWDFITENVVFMMDPWEQRRYELVKDMYLDSAFRHSTKISCFSDLLKSADALINLLKKASTKED